MNEFSVYQFFPDDTWERVREGVSAKEAFMAALHYSSSVGAQIGTTRRVIITDGGDFTTFEWKSGEGITYPPEAAGRDPRDANLSALEDRP